MPSEGGIDPTSEFLDRSKTCSNVNALIALGIVPEKEQREREMLVNDVILAIKKGREPANELKLILRDLNFLNVLIVSGIGPISLLIDSARTSSDCNEGGIGPLSELDSKFND